MHGLGEFSKSPTAHPRIAVNSPQRTGETVEEPRQTFADVALRAMVAKGIKIHLANAIQDRHITFGIR
jgi:hypothetical protein